MTKLANRAFGIPVRASKYNNVKTKVDAITFDSKAEARRYQELKLLKYAGEIRWFNRQPSFLIGNQVRYRPDFIVCGKTGSIWIEDVKGFQTATFKIKAKFFAEQYPDLPLVLVK